MITLNLGERDSVANPSKEVSHAVLPTSLKHVPSIIAMKPVTRPARRADEMIAQTYSPLGCEKEIL
jgi:hypothetical protein